MDHFAEAFEKAKDTFEHRGLLDAFSLVGPEIECRYRLGVLLGRNEFRRSREEFLDDLTAFVVSQTSPEAAMFCCTEHHCQFVVAFLRRLCELRGNRNVARKETKEHRALEVLLRHPKWADEQIVSEVGATLNAVKRWPLFRYARRCQQFYEQRVEGWYFPRPASDGR